MASPADLPNELKAIVCRYCSQGTLRNLSLARRSWVAPCNEALYQQITLWIDMRRDISGFIDLFQRLSRGEHRPERISALYIDSIPINPRNKARPRFCHQCVKENDYPECERDALGPRPRGRCPSRDCHNFVDVNNMIFAANLAVGLPSLTSLRVLSLFRSTTGYNPLLEVALDRLSTKITMGTLRYLQLGTTLFDLQFKAKSLMATLARSSEDADNKIPPPMAISSHNPRDGSVSKMLLRRGTLPLEVDHNTKELVFRLYFYEPLAKVTISDLVNAVAAFDSPSWIQWQPLRGYKAIRLYLRPEHTVWVGPLAEAVARTWPFIVEMTLLFYGSEQAKGSVTSLTAEEFIEALSPLPELRTVHASSASKDSLNFEAVKFVEVAREKRRLLKLESVMIGRHTWNLARSN
ncbi:hypothetical protein BKA62DRAFT_724407 [Auriculariales sp. MPI-PUGE-AT-0066]|nr:hypothetical protein BKA62DRAFT_724407 [Auriculariales sp. MPI-PUGE-AT-0066]